MRERGVKVTVNEHYGPLTRENDAHFEEIRRAMGMPEKTKEIPHDIGDKKYASLFMDLLHKPALDMGMAFWWQDGRRRNAHGRPGSVPLDPACGIHGHGTNHRAAGHRVLPPWQRRRFAPLRRFFHSETFMESGNRCRC